MPVLLYSCMRTRVPRNRGALQGTNQNRLGERTENSEDTYSDPESSEVTLTDEGELSEDADDLTAQRSEMHGGPFDVREEPGPDADQVHQCQTARRIFPASDYATLVPEVPNRYQSEGLSAVHRAD